MKIVVLDGYTENPGDLSWDELEKLGELTVYDRTAYAESPLIAERIGDAEIVVMNKTPISRATMDKCPNIKLIAVLATGYNVVDCACARERAFPSSTSRPTARRPSVSSPSRCCWRSAIISATTAKASTREGGQTMPTGATGTIRSSSWRARPSASSASAASVRRRAAWRKRSA